MKIDTHSLWTTRRSITFALILCLVMVIGASSAQEPPSTINAAIPQRAAAEDGEGVRPTIDRNSLGIERGDVVTAITESLDPDYVLPNALVPESGPITVLVELEGAAAGAIWQDAANPGALVPQVASRSASLLAQQSSLLAQMQSQFSVQKLGDLSITANALILRIDAANLEALEAMPGVARVIPDQFGEFTNADSVPFIGAISVWENSTGITGTGIRIGIIDSGVDYTHANFNGSGNPATYAGNDASTLADIGFDGSRIVGGYDFVGEGWDAGLPLNPDDDPIDCNGHGSHVAGTAAGSGVNSDGSTYNGPYDASTTAMDLSIGPGVAPEAEIYALRIGGCGPSVSFVAAAQAVEFAMDPNGDSNPADRLDVTNNSYGGFYGSPQELLTQQFNIATQAGVVMVGSAGNEGDTYYVNGSPNVADGTIAVASTTNDTTYGGVRLLSGEVGAYPSYPTIIPASQSVNGASGYFGPSWVRRVGDAGTGGTGGCSPSDYDSVPRDGMPFVVIFDWDDGTCGSNQRMTTAVDTLGVYGDGSGGQLHGLIAVTPVDDFPFILLSCGYDDGGGATKAPVPCVSILREDGLNILANPLPYDVDMDSALTSTLGFSEGDQISSFSSRGPRMGAETGLQILKPDIAAPGDFIYSTAAGTGTDGTYLGGTSMASPHIAGSAALMRELHPTWTVAQIKALLMNTATNDVWTEPDQSGLNYGVSRVGGGRVDLANAVSTEVIAYGTSAPERVSVSFGLIEAVTAETRSQTITVQNLGTTPRTYDITFDQRNDTPMAQFSVSPSSVSVPAGGSVTLNVTLSLDPTAAQPHTPDPTSSLTQTSPLVLGGIPRHFVAEEGGYVVLTPTDSSSVLRVAVHAVPRPASDMAADSATVAVGPDLVGLTTINLAGTEVFTGGNLPYDTWSIVTAFEKVYESPNDGFSPAGFDRGDLQYIGLSSDLNFWLDLTGGDLDAALANTTVYMALSVYGDWSTANAYETLFDIYFDTDGDLAEDWNLFNWDLGTAAAAFGIGADPTDIFIGFIQDLNTGSAAFVVPNEFFADEIDLYLLNNNVMVFPIPAGLLGLNSTNSTLSFYVDVLGELNFTDSTRLSGDYINYDVAAAPLSFSDDSGLQGGPYPGLTWYVDLDGLFIPVDYDLSAVTTLPEIMLVHHHNASGNRVEILTLEASNEADLEAGISVSDEAPGEGITINSFADAINNGPASSSGVVIEHTLPVGLTYANDDCPTGSTVTGGSGSPTVITCDYGTVVVPSGFSLSMMVQSVVDSGTNGSELVLRTDVSQGVAVNDPNTSNNAAGIRVCVGGNAATCNTTPVVLGNGGTTAGGTIGDFVVPDTLFAITPMSTFAQAGDSVEWKVSINNTSGAAINNARISLTLPGSITVESATSTSGTVSIGTQLAAARYTMGPLGQPRSFNQSLQESVIQFTQDVIQAGEQVVITIFTRIPATYSQSSVMMSGTLYGNGTTLANTSATLLLVSELPATGETPLWQELVVILMLMGGAAVVFGLGGAYRKRRAF